MNSNLRDAHDFARATLKTAAERQKNSYDTKVRLVEYKVGDLVWRNQKKNVAGIKQKIARKWSGHLVIVRK